MRITGYSSMHAHLKWGLLFIGGMAAMAALLTPRPVAMVPPSQASEPLGESATQVVSAAPSRADELSNAFRAAAKSVLPAVVQIRGQMQMGNLHHATAWSDWCLRTVPSADLLPNLRRRLDTSPSMALPIRRWGPASSSTNRGSS